MEENHKIIAQECIDGAYNSTMSFPEIVGTLIRNGFESYHIDYLRGTATYYLASGDNFELFLPESHSAIAEKFSAAEVQAAIREAQQQVEGYTYSGFCEKVTAAGCAGYIVSFLGKRVIYLGRTAETHTELFPQ